MEIQPEKEVRTELTHNRRASGRLSIRSLKIDLDPTIAFGDVVRKLQQPR